MFLKISIIIIITEIQINMNNGMLNKKAFKKFKCKIEINALVIPQAGQEIPVTDLKIHVTGIFNTNNKNKIKISKIKTFFILFFIITIFSKFNK